MVKSNSVLQNLVSQLEWITFTFACEGFGVGGWGVEDVVLAIP